MLIYALKYLAFMQILRKRDTYRKRKSHIEAVNCLFEENSEYGK